MAQSLREAFATEIASRLPHLREAADPSVVRRDVHTLVSSAWVVGEAGISELARTVEKQFEHREEPDLPALISALERYLS